MAKAKQRTVRRVRELAEQQRFPELLGMLVEELDRHPELPAALTPDERTELLDALLLPAVALNRVLEEPGGLTLLREFTVPQLRQVLSAPGLSERIRADCRRLIAEYEAADPRH